MSLRNAITGENGLGLGDSRWASGGHRAKATADSLRRLFQQGEQHAKMIRLALDRLAKLA
jgi:hypothetical protein